MILSLFWSGVMETEAGSRGLTIRITWGDWALAAIVPGIASLLIVPYVLYKIYAPELKSTPEAPKMAKEELEKMGPMDFNQKVMLCVFLGTIILWSTATFTGVDATTTAFLGLGVFRTRLYDNYLAHPLLFAVILLTVAALFGIRIFLAKGALLAAWASSAVTIVGATFYGVIGLFPNLIPSSLDPAWSLTIYNASSSSYTLGVMTIVALIFVPIVLLYQGWTYWVFRKRVEGKPDRLVY